MAWTITRLTLSLMAVAGAAVAAQPPSVARFRIDPGRYLAHVKILASDDFGGRGNGAPGLRQAAEYVANQFSRAELDGGGDRGSYLQSFDIESPLEDAAGTLLVRTAEGETAFRIGQHYYPLSASSGQAPPPPASSLVFAGYGIEAPGLGYDDYDGLDVAGKAVVVFTHEPQEGDDTSPFEGRALTPHSDIRHKATLAAARGARLLIVVEDPSHVTDRALTRDWERDPQIDRYDLPVVRLERSRLDRSLTAIDFESTARLIDRTLRPASQPLADVTVTPIDPLTRPAPRVSNVIGIWRGRDDAVAREAVVLGAHYDHLGHGGRFSEAPRDVGEVHNGADDNASGTAALIAIGEVLARGGTRFRRPIVLAAFAGEEIGLLGSRQFVRRLPAGVGSVVAMINLDMIGRARGRVMVSGADRAPFRALVRELRPLSRLRLADFRDGYADGASDNASFERERVPTLAFFTGFHDDYHRPSDDWDRIDAPGAAQIAQLAATIAARVAHR